MRRLRLLLSVSLLGVVSPAVASKGNTGAEFLKIGAGARPAALGDTQAALAEGALAALWNPAALGGLSSAEISLTHNRWFEGIQDQRFVAAVPTKSVGTLALAYERLAINDFLSFDAQGTNTGAVNSGDSVISLAWGRNLAQGATGGSGLYAGLAAKTINEKIAGVSASGFALDFGFLFRPWGLTAQRLPWVRRSSLGFSAKNLGQGLKYDEENTPLPTEYNLGAGYSQPLGGDILNLGLDYHLVTGETAAVSAGLEYWMKNLLALRLGYRTSDVNGLGFRAGAGFKVGKIQADYAWAATGEDFGPSHRITLTYRFGPAAVAPGLAADLFDDYVARGKRHMELGLYDRAILEFNEALSIHPGDESVRVLLLECGEKMEKAAP